MLSLVDKDYLNAGQEDDSPTQSQFPILRIWDLTTTRDTLPDKLPVLLRSVRIGTGGRGYPVSIGRGRCDAWTSQHPMQPLAALPHELTCFRVTSLHRYHALP